MGTDSIVGEAPRRSCGASSARCAILDLVEDRVECSRTRSPQTESIRLRLDKFAFHGRLQHDAQ